MRRIARLLASIALALVPTAGFCQSGPPAVGPPSRPPSLALALKALSEQSLPQDTLILTVGAENVPAQRQVQPIPVPNTNVDVNGNVIPPPPDPTTMNGVLAIYGRAWQTFGSVAAITAPTMTVLALDPQILNLDPVDLSPSAAMKILLGSLSKAEWQQVASGGLAVAGLDQDQQALLRAAVHAPIDVLPSTTSWSPPRWANGEAYSDFIDKTQAYEQSYSSGAITITPDMVGSARIKAYLTTSYALPVPGAQNGMSIGIPVNSAIPNLYQISMMASSSTPSRSLANLVLPKVANTLKTGDLNWNSRALGATVSVVGVKTVGDLVAQVAKATGLELYCDPHYASRSVLVLDTTGRPQRARELLEALCLCVSGTFRAVGPAFVLTDDILGVASRDALLEDLGTSWQNRLRKLTEEADNQLTADDWTKSLGFFPGDPNALTQDQLKSAQGGTDVDLSFSQLSAAAQSALQSKVDQLSSFVGDPYFSKIQGVLGPTNKVNAMVEMRIVLDVPNVGLVALDNGTSFMDVFPGHNGGTPPGPPAPPSGPQKPATYPANLAGVICAPRTAAEGRAVVDQMAVMGLHLLYCDVFTGGKAYVANSGVAPGSSEAASTLSAAIEEGKAKCVKVIALLDVFSWGKIDLKARLSLLPDGVGEGQTVTLETGTASLRRRIAEQILPDYLPAPSVTDRWVSPSDPAVQNALSQLVGAVSATPGLAGVAFQDASPPGYLSDHNPADPRTTELGYGPAARLAFLRARGADPIDIDDNIQTMSTGSAPLNLDIPSFETSRDTPGGQWLPGLEPAWKKAREIADEDEMARLYTLVRNASATLPLFLRDPVTDFTFAPWNSPKLLISAQSPKAPLDPSDSPAGAMVALDYGPVRSYAYSLPGVISILEGMVAKAKTPVGILFDLSTEPSPDGPVRDLTVMGEHVTFVVNGNASPQEGAHGQSQ